MATYTDKQIARAKKAYYNFMQYRAIEYFTPEFIGMNEANRRYDSHNNLVREVKNGNKELEREWKLFFLKEEVKADRKEEESKAKLKANKDASALILEPVKKLRKLVDFGKWLNTPGNKFRKEHFNKKYTNESVEAYLLTL